MYDKLKATKAAIGTITGKLFDLFSYGSKGASPIAWAADPEVIDPIGETRRQLPTDYFKSLEDNDVVAGTDGMTKKKFIETLPKWARPAFRNKVYVGLVGPAHQEQIIELGSRTSSKEPNYSLQDIDAIVYGMGDVAPDVPEELGPNFPAWVKGNEKRLSKIGGWEGILKTYGSGAGNSQYTAAKKR